MEYWPDGTIKSQNNAFTLRSEKSIAYEDRHNILNAQRTSSRVSKARAGGLDPMGNKRVNLETANFHVYSKAKK
jgi:hypothetical protein